MWLWQFWKLQWGIRELCFFSGGQILQMSLRQSSVQFGFVCGFFFPFWRIKLMLQISWLCCSGRAIVRRGRFSQMAEEWVISLPEPGKTRVSDWVLKFGASQIKRKLIHWSMEHLPVHGEGIRFSIRSWSRAKTWYHWNWGQSSKSYQQEQDYILDIFLNDRRHWAQSETRWKALRLLICERSDWIF